MSRQIEHDNYVRNFRNLMLGVPALTVALAVITISICHAFTPKSALIDRYATEARRSYEAREFQRAKECYQRLWLHTGGSPEIRYRLAMSEFGLGNKEAALSALARLAPLDGEGYAPAHIWWAERYFSSPRAASGEEDKKLAETHLFSALKSEPDNAEAHALLGGLYLSWNRPALAEQHLQFAVQKLPLLRLPLAQAYVANGKAELARIQAEMAQKYLAKQSELNPENHLTRFQRAQVSLFLKDFAGAAAILREGLAASGASAFRLSLGNVYEAWVDAIEKDVVVVKEENLNRLAEGLSYDAGNVSLLRRLVATSRAQNELSEKATAMINQALADGKSVATIHLFLAIEAHRRGELDEARRNYEEVYRREPQVAVAVNNLAWLLAHANPPELDRAKNMIDEAVRQWPDLAELHDTRGHILMKLQRWDEAREEFEKLLPVRSTSEDLHLALAEAYRQLRQFEKATEHRQLAQRYAKDPIESASDQ